MSRARWITAQALVLAIAGVGVVAPTRADVMPGLPAERAGSSGAVCSVEQGSGRSTEVPVASLVDGPARLEVFAAGRPAGSAEIGSLSGTASFDIGDVAAVGLAGALGELPAADAAATSVISGQGLLALGACVASPSDQVMLAGGSTASGQGFLIHLMNPYSADARVELTVTTEAGLESNDRFESVAVPRGDSVTLDMAVLIPGREVIAVTVDSVVGNVIVAGRQDAGADSALWAAAIPGQDWFMPVGAAVRGGRVLIVSPINAPVEFQVDLYSEEGFEERYLTGTVPARSHVWVDLAEAPGELVAVRVLSAAPVVATFVASGENGVAVDNGVPLASSRWLLAGAGSLEVAGESLILLNPGLEPATVRLEALGGSGNVSELDLAPDSVVEVEVGSAEGYLVSATGEIVVLWVASGEGVIAVSTGKPVGE